MYRVLMVDDDETLLQLNQNYFMKKGYEVFSAQNAKEAIQIVRTAKLDCVILDIDLPDMDGYEVCSCIRETTALPIVFLSGYGDQYSKIRGLTIGGDDYITKPYDLAELELRVRIRIARHLKLECAEILRFADLVLDSGTCTIYYQGIPGDFSPLDFKLLFFLAKHPAQIFSYEQLYDRIWREPLNESRHTLQARIAKIRQKLNQLCPGHEYIRTVRRQGYYFSP